MKLYYSAGACSLAPHILLRETKLPFTLERVDLTAHKTVGGDDYYRINSKGTVPVIELEDGERLSEGPISELHKSYTPLFSADVEAACKSVFRSSLLKKYGWLAARLEDRDYLTGDAFTAADAYLYAVTRWAAHVDLDLSAIEPVQRFMRRTGERESVREALQAEGLPLGRRA